MFKKTLIRYYEIRHDYLIHKINKRRTKIVKIDNKIDELAKKRWNLINGKSN